MEPEVVERIAALAAGQGAGDPAAVLPVRRRGGAEFYVCAFPDLAAELRWLVVDAAGEPVLRRRLVRDVVELAAMCETAEEAAAALAADEALPLLREARVLAEEHGVEEAARAARVTAEALEELVDRTPGVRVAEAPYLDRMAALATAVADRFELLRDAAGNVTLRLSAAPGGDPLEPLARALWDAVRLLARDGAPDRFAATMESAMGAASSLADDVERNYLVPLGDAER